MADPEPQEAQLIGTFTTKGVLKHVFQSPKHALNPPPPQEPVQEPIPDAWIPKHPKRCVIRPKELTDFVPSAG